MFDGTDCGKSTRKMAGRSGASRNRAHQHGATPKILGRPCVAETHEAGIGEWHTPGPDAPRAGWALCVGRRWRTRDLPRYGWTLPVAEVEGECGRSRTSLRFRSEEAPRSFAPAHVGGDLEATGPVGGRPEQRRADGADVVREGCRATGAQTAASSSPMCR